MVVERIRVYYDRDGCPMSLSALVRIEPDWAVSRIRVSEKTESDLAASQARELGLRRALERVLSLGHNDDCLFCGFKDNQARIALALPAPDLGERP